MQLRVCLFRILMLPFFIVPCVHGQTAQLLTHTVLSPAPPDSVHWEKAIGNFTSTTYPSYFLGTDKNGYVYDNQKGSNCSIGVPAQYYERSRTFTYPGDQYAGLIASQFTRIVWLANPLNWGGSLCNGWAVVTITGNRGGHELHLVDLDGDGKLDVLASGSDVPTDIETAFLGFQDKYNSWSQGAFSPPTGESVDAIAIANVNGGARTNIVACNPANNSLYWYQNPGGSAARGSGWVTHLIATTSVQGQPACKQGIALAVLPVPGRDLLIIGSGEQDASGNPWPTGLGYYDPGSTPNALWTFHQLDSTYRDIHQVAVDNLDGVPFFTVAEQEQASPMCNSRGYNDHGSSYNGCRVSVFPWNGTGFNQPTVVSNLGTHNQTLYQLNGVEYMSGANHDGYGATDPAYNLWTFNFSGAVTPPPGLTPGSYSIKDPNTGNTMDLGWALNPQWGDGTYVYLYNYNGGPSQQIVLNGAGMLQSEASPDRYLYNLGGALALGATGDTFTIAANGNGYTIQDKTAGGLYVNNASAITPPNKLSLSTTPTVWMFTTVGGSGGGGGGGGGGGTTLSTGKSYTFQDGMSNTMDLGWALNPARGVGPYVYLYAYRDNIDQQITYTASKQLQSVANPGEYLYNDGGALALGTSGDTFTITTSGSGYTVYDSTAGLYVNTPGKTLPPNKLTLSSSPTVWMVKGS